MKAFTSAMAIFAILAGIGTLVSCTASKPTSEEVKTRETDTYVFTDELVGCKAFHVQNKWANNSIMVVRCPHSTTTTVDGKHSITVDSQ